MSDLSASSLDRLGDRLREGAAAEIDWAQLSGYRKTVWERAFNWITLIQSKSSNFPFTGRLKTDFSILQKLRRQPSIRLRQMDDIAGCRIIVPDRTVQNQMMSMTEGLGRAKLRDRRSTPSASYRAVHVILADVPLEVQIRTELQDAWAELSEALADRHGIEVKYGGGPTLIKWSLTSLSVWIDALERNALDELAAELVEYGQVPTTKHDVVKALEEIRRRFL